jgi:hypothetical protein
MTHCAISRQIIGQPCHDIAQCAEIWNSQISAESFDHCYKMCCTSNLHVAPIIIFDEIHKYSNWETYIKGFFDGLKTAAVNTV